MSPSPVPTPVPPDDYGPLVALALMVLVIGLLYWLIIGRRQGRRPGSGGWN